jgi:hypothetical protein
MKSADSIVTQMLHIIPKQKFLDAVRELGTDKHYKQFFSWDHFITLVYGHLTGASSLRDIVGSILQMKAKQPSCYWKVVFPHHPPFHTLIN